MEFDIKKLTLKEKIGQMIGLAFAGGEYSPELAMQTVEQLTLEVGQDNW